jgi:hypothetical protein
MFYGEYFGSKADICKEFNIGDFDGVVLFADYSYEDYSGDAVVLYVNDGKFYLVDGGHCSCHGLEDQWSPEEMTVDMLRHLAKEGHGKVGAAASESLRALDELNLIGSPDDHVAVAMKLRYG